MPTRSMHMPDVLAIAALGAAAALSPAAAQEFEAVQGNTSVTDFVSRQMGTRPATVIVLLSGDPVAVVQRDLGRRLNPSERNAIIASRLAEQRAMHWAIGQLGGKVLAQLQSALNGIKVSIPEGRLAALRKLPGVVDVKRVGNLRARQRQRGADDGCAGRVAVARPVPRSGHEGRDPGHRHRLHACQLRWPRDGRRVQRRLRGEHRRGEPGLVRARGAQGQGRNRSGR